MFVLHVAATKERSPQAIFWEDRCFAGDGEQIVFLYLKWIFVGDDAYIVPPYLRGIFRRGDDRIVPLIQK